MGKEDDEGKLGMEVREMGLTADDIKRLAKAIKRDIVEEAYVEGLSALEGIDRFELALLELVKTKNK